MNYLTFCLFLLWIEWLTTQFPLLGNFLCWCLETDENADADGHSRLCKEDDKCDDVDVRGKLLFACCLLIYVYSDD